jgi:hypothetical protein
MDTNPVDSTDAASIRSTSSFLATDSINPLIKDGLQSDSDDDDVVEIIRPNEPSSLVKRNAIETLTTMGFDLKSVIRVLGEHQDYNYNIEQAANALLGG